jgi:hemin uptake protein HemP
MTAQSLPKSQASVSVIDVRDLLGPDLRAFLRLDDQTYTLRITRNGKLILTK